MSTSALQGSVILIARPGERAREDQRLAALLETFPRGTIETVVVHTGHPALTTYANPVGDHWVQIVETPSSCECEAIALGETMVTSFPCLYVCAPVTLPGASAARLFDELARPGVLAVRPHVVYDSDGTSVLVRRYYQARSRIPCIRDSGFDAGVLGLTSEGRDRYGDAVDGIADDVIAQQLFTRDELRIVDGPPARLEVPRTGRALLARLTGTVRRDRRSRGALSVRGTTPRTARSVARLAMVPGSTASALTYVAFAAASRLGSDDPNCACRVAAA